MKTSVTLLLAATALQAFAEPARVLEIDPGQVAAFGIETAALEPVGQAVSNTFPARVAVPNASLRVVGAPLEGVVESLLVAEGESVAEDQRLARIRSGGLLELQAAYLDARTRRSLSAETVRRERKLHADGIVAERRLLEAESRHRELLNTEEHDRQALRLAGMSDGAVEALARDRQLSPVLDVKAPLSGVVLTQVATAGQRVAPADPLYHIGDLTTLWVEVHVPLERLGSVAPGSSVDLPQLGIRAEVITVGRMIHGTDQGVLVRAAVTEGAGRLRPGQFVEARLYQRTGVGTVRVPGNAVVHSNGQDYVFARHPDGFLVVPAAVEARQGDVAVVRADLPPDSQVVVRGTAALKAAWGGGAE